MKPIHILNLGAGVQSTALYLMDRDGSLAEELSLPRIDFAVFADTQDEPAEVYRHLEWLKSLPGGAPILTDTAGRLGDDLINGITAEGSRFASIPAFTSDTEGTPGGITRRQCTREYKTRVVERVIRRQILGLEPKRPVPRDVRILQSFGLSFDEPRRVARVRDRYHAHPWADPAFPLFDLFMTRGDCLAYLARAAPGREIPRSACVFCPYKTNAEWRRLRDQDPEGWARAVAVDHGMRQADAVYTRKLDHRLYVHRSCVPLAQADIDGPEPAEQQRRFDFSGLGFSVSDSECEGMCGV